MLYKSEHLVVDTTAFIQNAPLQEMGKNIVTIQEVVNEITSKRQLRRLVVLPYDLKIINVFPENISFITEFSKKTGDYPSLSATDIKLMALAYQLEKNYVGVDHLKSAPENNKIVSLQPPQLPVSELAGFFKGEDNASQSNTETTISEEIKPLADSSTDTGIENNCPRTEAEIVNDKTITQQISHEDFKVRKMEENPENMVEVNSAVNDVSKTNHEDDCNKTEVEIRQNITHQTFVNSSKVKGLEEKFEDCDKIHENSLEADLSTLCITDILQPVSDEEYESEDVCEDDDDDDDDSDWITPENVNRVKQQMDFGLTEDKAVVVACLTTDFAMQNVLKQIGLNILGLDGRVIKHLRTFIFRCYTCFKTTSNMTKVFCPKCGNKTLKKVAVSVDENGQQRIHINPRRPLTARGKRFSLPKPQGGKHANNPILCADQPMPDQRPSRLARTKTNPLDDNYIAGFSPFVMRDVNSKSALLGIRGSNQGLKYWMRKNPNEVVKHRRKKK